MEFTLIIVALLALLALAFWIKRRRLRRLSLEIIERFREPGALKERKRLWRKWDFVSGLSTLL